MSRTLAWERLGTRFITNVEGPTMKWSQDISQLNATAAEGAGIIGTWPKSDQMTVTPINELSARKNSFLDIFSSNGTKISSINLDFGDISDICIMRDETIVIVTESGIARHYTDYGKNFTQIQFPYRVRYVRMSGTNYFVLFDLPTQDDIEPDLKLGVVSNCRASEPSFRVITASIKPSNIVSWCIVPGNEDSGRYSAHVFVDQQNRVLTYDLELMDKSHRVVMHDIPNKLVKVSVDNEYIALSDGENRIMILSTDIFETTFESKEVPKHADIYWIGSDLIGLEPQIRDGEIEVVDLTSSSSLNTNNFFFEEEHVLFFSEIDGLRVVGSQNHSILQPVLRPTLETFKLGSVHPSAILFSCVNQIDSGTPRSEQTIKMLEQKKLLNAVDTCISAALLEFEPKFQKRLMSAAAFGKSILEAFDTTRYLATLTDLKIANSLRSMGNLGMFITNAQINELGTVVLIERLQLRKLWGEAISLAKLMSLPVEPIYIAWACWVIEEEDSASDSEIINEIQSKLGKLPTYSRTKIAQKTLETGRQDLAVTFTEEEPVISERVILLLQMDKVQQALEHAVKSRNPYLVDYVLILLTEKLSLPQLIRAVGGNMTAVYRQKDLLQANSIQDMQHKQQSENQVHDFLYQMDLRAQSIKLEFREILKERDVAKKTRLLRSLEKKFSTLSKQFQPESKACSDWADLLTLQQQLNESYNLDISGKSAAETVMALLRLSQVNAAQKIKSKLGITDRQFMWLRIRALVDRRDFEDLWDLSQIRKPLISFQVFFNVCFEAGNKEQASRYIHLISEAPLEEKVRLCVKCENYDLARTFAGRNVELQGLIP